MVEVRALERKGVTASHQGAGLALSQRLPLLMASARLVAASVMHGVHGRRRAGSGETFWQFRSYSPGEAAHRIDWRRSSRDDRLYVREREWEAAHDIWLWVDRSPSMHYISSLARESKVDRALVLTMACADLLVKGGERVGIIDLTRPRASRDIVERLAQALVQQDTSVSVADEIPAPNPLPPRTQAILIGDFLSTAAQVVTMLDALAARGARGHIIMIADPAEESFPFSGHTEFVDFDTNARLRAGNAESFRALYHARLASHRDTIARRAVALGWSFAVHRTDKPASEALLALLTRIEVMESN